MIALSFNFARRARIKRKMHVEALKVSENGDAAL